MHHFGRYCMSAHFGGRVAQSSRAHFMVARAMCTLTGFRDVGESLRAQFYRDGFCVVPGVLSSDQLDGTKTQGETEV